jgi:glyoxylase I family protein
MQKNKLKPNQSWLGFNYYNTNATTTKIHHMLIFVLIIKNQNLHERSRLIIIQEIYRQERQPYKLDLALNGECDWIILISNPPKRPSTPEVVGIT